MSTTVNAGRLRPTKIIYSLHPQNPLLDARIFDISCTLCHIIACFVANFIPIATRVMGRGKIRLAAFDGPSPNPPPLWTQKSRIYLLHKPSYSQVCPKFRCHGNQGGSGVKLYNTIRLAIVEYHTLEPTFIHSQSYNRLKNCLIFPIGAIVIFSNFSNKYVKY